MASTFKRLIEMVHFNVSCTKAHILNPINPNRTLCDRRGPSGGFYHYLTLEAGDLNLRLQQEYFNPYPGHETLGDESHLCKTCEKRWRTLERLRKETCTICGGSGTVRSRGETEWCYYCNEGGHNA